MVFGVLSLLAGHSYSFRCTEIKSLVLIYTAGTHGIWFCGFNSGKLHNVCFNTSYYFFLYIDNTESEFQKKIPFLKLDRMGVVFESETIQN